MTNIFLAVNLLGNEQLPAKPSSCDDTNDVICIDDDDDIDADSTEVCAAKKCLKPSGEFLL
jgi:hypothetical protein